MIALGCDPGLTSGGLVILDTAARRVLLSYEWRPMAARKADPGPMIERVILDGIHPERSTTVRVPRAQHDAESVGHALALFDSWLYAVAVAGAVAIEGVAPYGGASGGASQASASRALGAWREWLICQTGRAPVEVLPATWRALLPKSGRRSGDLDRAGERWCDLTLPGHGLTTAGGWDAAVMGWWVAAGVRR